MTYKNRHPLRGVWRGIVHKCHNPKSDCYKYYGGKGISVCDRWRESFASFVDDVGPRPGPEFRLVRLDLSKGFEPSNCAWGLRGEEGSGGGREYALLCDGMVSVPIGTSAAAWAKRGEILAEMAMKGVAMPVELVWRMGGEDGWRGMS